MKKTYSGLVIGSILVGALAFGGAKIDLPSLVKELYKMQTYDKATTYEYNLKTAAVPAYTTWQVADTTEAFNAAEMAPFLDTLLSWYFACPSTKSYRGAVYVHYGNSKAVFSGAQLWKQRIFLDSTGRSGTTPQYANMKPANCDSVIVGRSLYWHWRLYGGGSDLIKLSYSKDTAATHIISTVKYKLGLVRRPQ
jgi:hypothetical protein